MIDVKAPRSVIAKEADRLTPWDFYLWAEHLYTDDGLKPMPAWWSRRYKAFSESGASEFVAAKGTRGGGSTNWVGWELAQAVLTPKRSDESIELILPIMAATVAQANGRSLNFQRGLTALGYRRLQARARGGARRSADGDLEDDGGKIRVGDMQFWASLPNATGINTIEFRDFHGRLLTIRTACASKAGASEYTAFDAFGDEVAQWGKGGAEDPRHVLNLLRTRLKGQRPGKSYLISQPLPDTEFYEICRAGSSKHRYVCTIGDDGVEADRRARAWLVGECEREARGSGPHAGFYARLAKDERLHQDLDPKSPWCPAWAILPVGGAEAEQYGLDVNSPEAAMQECARLSMMDVGREDGFDPIEQLWWGFGARPMAAGAYQWIDAVCVDRCISQERLARWEM